MPIPRYVNVVAGKNDLWSSFFRSIAFRRLFSTNAISFSLEGLGPRLRAVFEELGGDQHPEKEKTMTHGGDLPEVEAGHKGPGSSKNGSLELEIAHSMPEWIAFLDVLIEGDYLSGRRGSGTLLFEGMPASKERKKEKDEETILSRGFASFASHRMDLMR